MSYKIITLGCKVNEYESEVMENLLENHGYVKSENHDICIVDVAVNDKDAAIEDVRSMIKDALNKTFQK